MIVPLLAPLEPIELPEDGRLDLRTLVRQQLLRASELSRELADLVGHDPEKGDAGDPDGSGHDRHVHIE